jgi:hypothetical protein
VPGYAEANSASAALAKRADAVEAGTQYLGSGKTTPSPDRFAAEFDPLSQGEKIAFAKGSRGNIDRVLGHQGQRPSGAPRRAAGRRRLERCQTRDCPWRGCGVRSDQLRRSQSEIPRHLQQGGGEQPDGAAHRGAEGNEAGPFIGNPVDQSEYNGEWVLRYARKEGCFENGRCPVEARPDRRLWRGGSHPVGSRGRAGFPFTGPHRGPQSASSKRGDGFEIRGSRGSGGSTS